jgi:PAS domain S-box-containing protein
MPDQSNENSARLLGDIEEHFSQLVSGVQDYAIFLLDASGRVLSWNAGAERIKGYKASEIIGQSFTKFYAPASIADEFPQEELRQAALVGRFEDQGWRVRKDGTQFWANVVITALYGEHHEVRGYLKITRDLTERKLAEETLRQSEERFRLMVEGVEEYGIFMLDPQGNISSWNAGAQRIKGYSADEIIGKHFSVFYSSEDIAAGKPERELETAIRRGRCEDEGWRVRKDRSLFWANVVITALFDKGRRLRGFAKLTRDMTERRKVEELLVADRHKNEFLAMLAHELRNPLAPISNGLQLLRMSPSDDPVFQQTTQIMERQLGHLVRLVDDLLDMSRIITGKISLHKEPVELSAVIARTLEEVQPLLDARGHELLVTQPSRPIVVDADAVRLAQVLSNMLANAAKYTEEPSQIFLSVERHGDEATVRVRDSGIGISAEFLPNVFDLFVQADHSLERSRGGLGIGLTLVKRIVELHGGSVGATSAGPGQGSEFIVRLPLTYDAVPVKSRAPHLAESAKAPRRRILVVDDNVDAAATIAKLLAAWGHEVHVAFNGPAALEAVRTFRPEILLLDIGLPGMSGYEVARQLRSDPSSKELLITALTGYGQSEDRQRSYEAGFDFHITKPPGPEVLEALVLAPQTFVGRLTSPKNN